MIIDMSTERDMALDMDIDMEMDAEICAYEEKKCFTWTFKYSDTE
jgi:hypothetical protein